MDSKCPAHQRDSHSGYMNAMRLFMMALQPAQAFFFLRAPFGQYGPVAATWALSVYRSRLAPWTRGESNHGKLSALRPLSHGRYRFATASAGPATSPSSTLCQTCTYPCLPGSRRRRGSAFWSWANGHSGSACYRTQRWVLWSHGTSSCFGGAGLFQNRRQHQGHSYCHARVLVDKALPAPGQTCSCQERWVVCLASPKWRYWSAWPEWHWSRIQRRDHLLAWREKAQLWPSHYCGTASALMISTVCSTTKPCCPKQSATKQPCASCLGVPSECQTPSENYWLPWDIDLVLLASRRGVTADTVGAWRPGW